MFVLDFRGAPGSIIERPTAWGRGNRLGWKVLGRLTGKPRYMVQESCLVHVEGHGVSITV